MKTLIVIASLLAAPAALFADSALQDLENASGVQLAALVQAEQNLQENVGHKPHFLPRHPQDVLAACQYIDAAFIRQPSLDEAVKSVNLCLQDRFSHDQKRLYSVEAEKCSASGCAEIEIIIRGEVGPDNRFLLEDLRYSVSKDPRNGKIHGWATRVVEVSRLAQTERHY